MKRRDSVLDVIFAIMLIVGVCMLLAVGIAGFPRWTGWTRPASIIGCCLVVAAIIYANVEADHGC